jgi:hypothetical protein
MLGATGNPGKAASAGVSINEARAGHIFRDADGHISDTAENRQLLESVANDASNILGTDKVGTTWAAILNPNGTQTWVGIRNGKVSDGGVNDTPKSYDPQIGLASPTLPSKKMSDSLTPSEAFLAMQLFLDRYFERGGCQSDDIAALLSGMSQAVWADGSTNDPAQWQDWLDAIQSALSSNDDLPGFLRPFGSSNNGSG